MAFIIKDRVKEATTSTGTGSVSLGGSLATFDTFQSVMVTGDTTFYAIVHTASGTDEWEVGVGTYNATTNELTRTTVLSGSAGTSAVDFSAGVKDIFMTYPSSKAVFLDANGDIDINGGTIDGTTIGATTANTGKFTTLQATGNVDFDGYIDMAGIDHPTHAEGRVYYDATHKTLSYQSDIADVEHEIGIEEHVRVYNNTGSTIAKGKPVYWSGNQNDVPTIALGNATEESKYNVQGLTAGDIAANSYGYVIVSGIVDGIDTSSLTAGQNVFMGLTDGALQNASPTYPNYPMCIGWVIKSDATDGIILVNQQNHSVNSFRVRTSAHIGDDLIVGGDLTVLGSQTIASSENVSIANAWNYFNSGDTIGALNTNFSGSGLNDASFTGHFTGPVSTTYYVRIDGVGTGTGGVDTFEWSTDNFATTVATNVDITGDDQLIHSSDNIAVKFEATTGHTSGDTWTGTAAPLAVDTGFATNRNTGASGVGYTHMGIYYDVSTDKWTVFDEYDPEPDGTIDTSHASFSYGTLKAGTFEGNLSGNVTGNLTGTATSANALATARTVGGVSFDGTANIDLPGVNTTGNQDTTGNAATATKLATARTIQLSGDVTGSATFDGSANINITATVGDDSHAHVISNVDGLQAALDAKADDTTTISAGGGLTGGGSIGVNRTISHADTSTQASLTALTGAAVVSDVDLDTYGHVTALATRNMTLADLGYTGETNATADQTITAGSGLTGGGTGDVTISHADTSSQASVNNSNGTVIQDITLDTYGHVTGLASFNLDGRYYTESEIDTRMEYSLYNIQSAAGNNLDSLAHFGWYNWPGTLPSNAPYGYGMMIYGTDGSQNQQLVQTYGGATNQVSLYGRRKTGGAWDTVWTQYFSDHYHPNADKWTTARTNTVTLTGDVTGTGSASVDGSGNWTVSLSTAVGNDSHSHSNYVLKTGDTMTGQLTPDTSGDYDQTAITSLTSAPIYYPEVNVGSSDTYLPAFHMRAVHSGGYRTHMNVGLHKDSSGWGGSSTGFYVALGGNDNNPTEAYKLTYGGEINHTVAGRFFADNYHPNADKWTTARTLTLSGDASGSVSWDGSANATLSVTVANDSHSHSTYITNNANDTSTGTIAFGTGTLDPDSYTSYSGGFGGIADGGGWSAPGVFVTGGTGKAAAMASGSGNVYFGTQDGTNTNSMATWLRVTQSSKVADFTNTPTVGGSTMWHAGNDGSGSGLDADTLDGIQGSSFLRSDANDTHTGTLTLDVVQVGNEIRLPNNTSLTDVTLTGTSDEDTGFNWSGSDAVNYVSGGLLKYNLNDVWHSGNDGSGSGLDADTLDGVQGSSFLRSDADANVSGMTEWQDNYQIRLGNDADFRMYFTGTHTYFRNYNHANGNIYFQGEDTGGVNHALLYMFTDNNRPYLTLYEDGAERLSTVSYGISVTGELRATDNITAYYSDERLKTKVGSIENPLDKVKSLEGFYYVENDVAKEHGFENEEQQVALSAQAVQAVMPEAVDLAPFDTATDEEGNVYSKSGENYLTVDYARLVPLLVESIKELEKRVAELEAKQ